MIFRNLLLSSTRLTIINDKNKEAILQVNFKIKKYNILKSTYLLKQYIVFLIDFELLFRQPQYF
jgi:hypothetical protein